MGIERSTFLIDGKGVIRKHLAKAEGPWPTEEASRPLRR